MSSQPATAPDPGLYGPHSVTWRVHADPSMALSGLRALLLQALHPLAMSGVAQHSDFRQDPWGRLFRTADYVGVTTYGSTEQARRAGAKVRGIHRKLAGIEPETGTAYRVDDPELLRWVHCVEVESFLSTAVRCGCGCRRRSRTATTPSRPSVPGWSGSTRRGCPPRSTRWRRTSATSGRSCG